MSPTLPGSQAMRQRSPLYNTEKFYGIQPTAQPQQMPQVDTSHALSSISQLMGPTPAEREAELRKQEAHNNKMMKWAGLFDGLRQLGNLYTTYKGATPQQLQAPYGQLEQQADRQRKLQAADDAYRREYANAYMRLQHGLNDDARKAKLAEAQLKWYKKRDEQNAEKVAIQKFKAETDRAYKNATLEQKERMNDIMADFYAGRISLMEAQTKLANVKANMGGFAPQRSLQQKETTTTTTDSKGHTTTKTVVSGPVGSTRSKGNSSNSTPPSRRRGKQAQSQSNTPPSRRE